jgi:hypothetical protein
MSQSQSSVARSDDVSRQLDAAAQTCAAHAERCAVPLRELALALTAAPQPVAAMSSTTSAALAAASDSKRAPAAAAIAPAAESFAAVASKAGGAGQDDEFDWFFADQPAAKSESTAAAKPAPVKCVQMLFAAVLCANLCSRPAALVEPIKRDRVPASKQLRCALMTGRWLCWLTVVFWDVMWCAVPQI